MLSLISMGSKGLSQVDLGEVAVWQFEGKDLFVS